jgi:anti-sigma regulatory factor (Ser/Thr protein kinase)
MSGVAPGGAVRGSSGGTVVNGRVRGPDGEEIVAGGRPDVAPGGDDTVSTVLPAVAPSVAAARRFVAAALRRQGAVPETIDTACLLTSELVTNALVHAGSRVTLAVSVGERGLRVEVGDMSSADPEPRSIGPDAVAGRGLHIVEAMSTRWGTSGAVDGKRVWFELDDTLR